MEKGCRRAARGGEWDATGTATGPGHLRPSARGAPAAATPSPSQVAAGAGRGGFRGRGGAPQGSSSCSAWGHFPPRASRRALRTPVRVAQVPGQRFCAGLSSPAGLSRGLSARASCRELGAGGRIKLSRNGTGCARL